MMKKHMYKITYDIKINKTTYKKHIYCEADNAKEAKNYFQTKYNGNCFYNKDRHAFHIEVKRADNDIINAKYAIIKAE